MTTPLCRYCARPIPRQMQHHWFREPNKTCAPIETDAVVAHDVPFWQRPRTKTECERLVGKEVFRVSYSSALPEAGAGRRVSSFLVWDGRSFTDPFFCSSKCRSALGQAAVEAGFFSVAYERAIKGDAIEIEVPTC